LSAISWDTDIKLYVLFYVYLFILHCVLDFVLLDVGQILSDFLAL